MESGRSSSIPTLPLPTRTPPLPAATVPLRCTWLCGFTGLDLFKKNSLVNTVQFSEHRCYLLTSVCHCDMTRWNNETTYKFVSAYVERECLWNIKSPLYKIRAAKDAAIKEIENLMGIEGFNKKEIKQKIKNIRSTYCQELRKMKESESSGLPAELVYVPKVKWFGILDECLKTFKAEGIEDDSNLTKPNITEENIEDEMTFLDAEIQGTLIKTNSREKKPIRRRKKQKIPDNETVPPASNEITVSANPLPPENEFDVFGKHVALQLNSLPLLLALDAQEHIQVYLNRTRREYIMQNTAEQLATGISIEIPMCSTQD